MAYSLRWRGGASAQLELLSHNGGAPDQYQLKYTPPFRSTLRPPVEPRPLTEADLEPINNGMDTVVRSALGIVRGGSNGNRDPGPEADNVQRMVRVGSQLYKFVVPPPVRTELRSPGLFLEIGVDEGLVGYPWELMHDGEDFLCNKHFIGRFVNVSERPIPLASEPPRPGEDLGELSVLVISVPRPRERPDGTSYRALPGADAELASLVELLADIPGVRPKVLRNDDAEFDAVWDAMQERHHIVHYSGHAHFDPDQPQQSALVLHDRDMSTGPLTALLGENAPVLCVVNGCESGAIDEWRNQYDVYGLAQALLGTGAYIIGSRWELVDSVAGTFAVPFYKALLQERKSLGVAVKEARCATLSQSPEGDFGWASYIFYGDPRVSFDFVG